MNDLSARFFLRYPRVTLVAVDLAKAIEGEQGMVSSRAEFGIHRLPLIQQEPVASLDDYVEAVDDDDDDDDDDDESHRQVEWLTERTRQWKLDVVNGFVGTLKPDNLPPGVSVVDTYTTDTALVVDWLPTCASDPGAALDAFLWSRGGGGGGGAHHHWFAVYDPLVSHGRAAEVAASVMAGANPHARMLCMEDLADGGLAVVDEILSAGACFFEATTELPDHRRIGNGPVSGSFAVVPVARTLHNSLGCRHRHRVVLDGAFVSIVDDAQLLGAVLQVMTRGSHAIFCLREQGQRPAAAAAAGGADYGLRLFAELPEWTSSFAEDLAARARYAYGFRTLISPRAPISLLGTDCAEISSGPWRGRAIAVPTTGAAAAPRRSPVLLSSPVVVVSGSKRVAINVPTRATTDEALELERAIQEERDTGETLWGYVPWLPVETEDEDAHRALARACLVVAAGFPRTVGTPRGVAAFIESKRESPSSGGLVEALSCLLGPPVCPLWTTVQSSTDRAKPGAFTTRADTVYDWKATLRVVAGYRCLLVLGAAGKGKEEEAPSLYLGLDPASTDWLAWKQQQVPGRAPGTRVPLGTLARRLVDPASCVFCSRDRTRNRADAARMYSAMLHSLFETTAQENSTTPPPPPPPPPFLDDDDDNDDDDDEYHEANDSDGEYHEAKEEEVPSRSDNEDELDNNRVQAATGFVSALLAASLTSFNKRDDHDNDVARTELFYARVRIGVKMALEHLESVSSPPSSSSVTTYAERNQLDAIATMTRSEFDIWLFIDQLARHERGMDEYLGTRHEWLRRLTTAEPVAAASRTDPGTIIGPVKVLLADASSKSTTATEEGKRVATAGRLFSERWLYHGLRALSGWNPPITNSIGSISDVHNLDLPADRSEYEALPVQPGISAPLPLEWVRGWERWLDSHCLALFGPLGKMLFGEEEALLAGGGVASTWYDKCISIVEATRLYVSKSNDVFCFPETIYGERIDGILGASSLEEDEEDGPTIAKIKRRDAVHFAAGLIVVLGLVKRASPRRPPPLCALGFSPDEPLMETAATALLDLFFLSETQHHDGSSKAPPPPQPPGWCRGEDVIHGIRLAVYRGQGVVNKSTTTRRRRLGVFASERVVEALPPGGVLLELVALDISDGAALVCVGREWMVPSSRVVEFPETIADSYHVLGVVVHRAAKGEG